MINLILLLTQLEHLVDRYSHWNLSLINTSLRKTHTCIAYLNFYVSANMERLVMWFTASCKYKHAPMKLGHPYPFVKFYRVTPSVCKRNLFYKSE